VAPLSAAPLCAAAPDGFESGCEVAVEEVGPALLVILEGIPEVAGEEVEELDDEASLGVDCDAIDGCAVGVGALRGFDTGGARLGFFCGLGVVTIGVAGVISDVGATGF